MHPVQQRTNFDNPFFGFVLRNIDYCKITEDL